MPVYIARLMAWFSSRNHQIRTLVERVALVALVILTSTSLQLVTVGMRGTTHELERSTPLIRDVIERSANPWNGTIVISIETLEEFRRILLPSLANIRFRATVTLLYNDMDPAPLHALLSHFSAENILFRCVDVSPYWKLTEREIDGKEKNAGHINTPVFAGPPTQPVE